MMFTWLRLKKEKACLKQQILFLEIGSVLLLLKLPFLFGEKKNWPKPLVLLTTEPKYKDLQRSTTLLDE